MRAGHQNESRGRWAHRLRACGTGGEERVNSQPLLLPRPPHLCTKGRIHRLLQFGLDVPIFPVERIERPDAWDPGSEAMVRMCNGKGR